MHKLISIIPYLLNNGNYYIRKLCQLLFKLIENRTDSEFCNICNRSGYCKHLKSKCKVCKILYTEKKS